MRISNLIISLSMAAAVVLSSCSKKEDPDLRDDMVGSYTGKLEYREKSTMSLISSEDVIVEVAKHASDNKAIDFKSGNHKLFTANKLTAASNGIAFDIPSQPFTYYHGPALQVEGINHIELGTAKYHGAYFSSTKKIKTAVVTKMNVGDDENPIEIETLVLIDVTKK